jgi:diguanylate cyclase (GGDEF)-like protein
MSHATSYFNSTWFVNKTGRILASAPNIDVVGQKLNSIGVMEALEKRTPVISEPYIGITGKLILLISVPAYDESGVYSGFLAGTIHLEEDNSLKNILGKHPEHQNDSYVFVVDSKGDIIYHPDEDRNKDNVIENKTVQEVLKGNSGNQVVINSKGITMFAGYAPSSTISKWGIISQTPKEAVIKPTIEVVKQISLFTIPFMMFVFIFSVYMLKKIVNPISNLASYAQQITEDKSSPIPKIPEWYFELKELKQAILLSVRFYENKITDVESESNIDPLTGYYNRLSLEKSIHDLDFYSVILFDIDRFKSVNDRYGHQIGDEVLIYIAKLVRKETRESDLCFRLGGEEFLIILPETDIGAAKSLADRIRKTLETTDSPIGKPITVSMGIGSYPNTANHFSELLNKTDQALYRAKKEGRNQVIIASSENNETD